MIGEDREIKGKIEGENEDEQQQMLLLQGATRGELDQCWWHRGLANAGHGSDGRTWAALLLRQKRRSGKEMAASARDCGSGYDDSAALGGAEIGG